MTDAALRDALRAARSASAIVRDDAIRAEVVMLRDELADLRAKFQASQALADQAIERAERAESSLRMYRGTLADMTAQRDQALYQRDTAEARAVDR